MLNGLLDNFAASNDRKGMLFEHLVINQVVNSAKARDLPLKLSYFRTRGGFEIDLIIEIAGRTFAVEIKAGRTDPTDATHLQQFHQYHEAVDGYFLVTSDVVPRKIGRVRVSGINDFLRAIGL